jgi:hypothetical protein
MKIIGLGMTLLVVLLFLDPGVYGLDVGISGEHGGASGSVNIGISAVKDASINAEVLVNGASLKPTISISGIGRLNENHQVTDSDGNHAEIHAKVVNGNGIQYSDALYPGEGSVAATGYVNAEQTLTVGQADSITCSQVPLIWQETKLVQV